jgi:hypothetical protein
LIIKETAVGLSKSTKTVNAEGQRKQREGLKAALKKKAFASAKALE